MKKVISDNFKNTDDALLVEKHIEDIPDTFIMGLIVAQFKSEILAEAKRLENEKT